MSRQDFSSEPPRSRWPIVLGAILGVVALVAATVVVTGALVGEDTTGPTPTRTSSSSSPSASSSTSGQPAAAGANGCLGGINPNTAVLQAQKKADLTGKGAAAFSATVMRWRQQYPPDKNYKQTAKQVMTDDAGAALLTIDAPKGDSEDSGWSTTSGASYRVVMASDEEATVEILMPSFVTSAEMPEGGKVMSAARWRLAAVDGQWRVKDMDPLEPNSEARTEVQADGHSFRGTC